MILLDPAPGMNWRDWGILIPFPAERPQKIIDFLGMSAKKFPGPVVSTGEALSVLGEKMPPEISQDDVELIHKKEYAGLLFQKNNEDALLRAILEIYELIDGDGNPHRYDKSLAKKTMREYFEAVVLKRLAGSYLAARLALEGGGGFCYYLSGGNHHARHDFGAGFCVLNDVIFMARKVQHEGRAKIIWIIDVDAHKGCGSAELVDFIRRGINPHPFEEGCAIITLSIHMAHGWPLDEATLAKSKPDRAPNIASDIEIPIEKSEERFYNQRLLEGLYQLEKRTSASCGGKPCDLAIVVDGDDPYEKDGLASSSLLNLTLNELVTRDTLVYNFLRERGIKSAWLLAGGYGESAWEGTAHFLKSLNVEEV
jgi:acetoin utilization deacetylase AcuC-like enzyme